MDELLQCLCIVFEKLRDAGLNRLPKKCQLFLKEVRYLELLILEKGLAADRKTIRATATCPVQKDAHEVRSFLGLCSNYRRFVKGFVPITKSLNQLTECQTTFHWTNECQEVFEDLKKKLCSLTVSQPDYLSI